MKIGHAFIGTVTGLLLPLAAANALTSFDPPTGQGAALVQLAIPAAGTFGRDEGDHNGDKDRYGHGDKDKGDHHCDKDHDRDGHKCDKSPSKPWW